MIDCPSCSRMHRNHEQVEKCAQRAAARAEREARREADLQRREANERQLPAADFIVRQANQGIAFDKILAALKREYPRRERPWTLWDVVREDTRKLLPTWRVDLDRATEMRLQRIHAGDWMGHYEGGVERNVLDEIPWTDEELKAADRRRAAEKKGRAA